jgi:hypothetical protein
VIAIAESQSNEPAKSNMLYVLLWPWASIDLNGPLVPTRKHWLIGISLTQSDTISVPVQSAEFHPWKQKSAPVGGGGGGDIDVGTGDIDVGTEGIDVGTG